MEILLSGLHMTYPEKRFPKFSMKDGKMRMVDEDGKVTEITQSS